MTRPMNREFYYLNIHPSYFKGHVQTGVLMNDVKRGVTRLSEDAYCPYWGSTATSLRFMSALVNLLGLERLQALSAELKYSEKTHYTLVVHTVTGLELVFKGVSGGYFGEGCRGCYDILKVCGFSQKQCEKAFQSGTFKIRRNLTLVKQ